MHLTDRTDFSLRMLLYLAARPEERIPVARIAQAYGLSQAHLAKCAQDLAALGLVTTTTGRSGGVQLARPPEEIRLGAVVRAIEPLALVECMGEANTCPIAPNCGLIPPLARARAAFLAVLDEATLADAIQSREARPREK